jgi:hypothetical protein
MLLKGKEKVRLKEALELSRGYLDFQPVDKKTAFILT